jgi:hypothetical protein
MSAPASYIAFDKDRRIGSGDLRQMARLAKANLDRGDVPILIFDACTSDRVEIDLRGSLEEILRRLPEQTAPVEPPRGPGRPKLGVVAREITLLPRHWAWLAQQRGGASVALRRLVDAARQASSGEDRIRLAQESTYRFVSATAASHPDYEEALRALFARDAAQFERRTADWPADLRDHARRLAAAAFAAAPAAAG